MKLKLFLTSFWGWLISWDKTKETTKIAVQFVEKERKEDEGENWVYNLPSNEKTKKTKKKKEKKV